MQKIISDNYIVAFWLDAGEEPSDEYLILQDAMYNKPKREKNTDYKLRADTLEWELVELPPEPDPGEEEATAEDYENALLDLGVRV